MAESAVFSLACKILSTIASPAFEKAYERGLSIWEARDELAKLRITVETIQAVLLDAEKKQQSSASVKNWIKRLKGVLYDVDDLLDEVATNDLLKQQMREGKTMVSLKQKVRVSFSNLNPLVSRNSIAKKVKAIRRSLGEISVDMAGLGFVPYDKEDEISNGTRRRQDPGCFVDSKDVIGRDEDKKAALKVLFHESNHARSDVPVVIAIVGIGGMGKTTLAQLVYNDEEVKRKFDARWFVCISHTLDEKEILGKIFQSIWEENYIGFTIGQLQTKIKEKIEGRNFLLVLDDVWDENHGRWLNRMKLLSCGAKWSKIVVTTRSSAVATAVDAFETLNLQGLSEEDSWDLFKRTAFAPGNENDPRRIDLGREIVKKCADVPLAITSIGNLLFEKNTIQEWESIRNEKLPVLGQSYEDGVMPVLKLSYDHLHSNLKQCFAYCSLFPKDYRIFKQELIYLWIAQGYIKQDNEDVSHSHFMYLLRRGFFQEAEEDKFGEIKSCKMHDLIHDLAQHVAGEESIMLTTPPRKSNCAKHLSIGGIKIDESWAFPGWILNVKGLRSCLLMNHGTSICNLTVLDQLFANFKLLRALSLQRMGIEKISSSIGELKHLRYLDLSKNKFRRLPDSITNLLNLLTLDISECGSLEALPANLRRLVSLNYLNINECDSLKHMPAGIEEMSCLRWLSDFKVGKVTSEVEKRSGLDALARLQHQLRESLRIGFEEYIEGEEYKGGDCNWQLPISPQLVDIRNFPGTRIAHWVNEPTSPQVPILRCIYLTNCRKVKRLPPFRCLPYLKHLRIFGSWELEYMEEEEEVNETAPWHVFFPCLERLELWGLQNLKGWSRRNCHQVSHTSEIAMQQQQQQQLLSFPLLSELLIFACPELKSMPSCPRICKLHLESTGSEVMEQLLLSSPSPSPSSSSSSCLKEIIITNCKGPISFRGVALTSLRELQIQGIDGLEVLHLASPHLREISIWCCYVLQSIHVEAPTTLCSISIGRCYQLKDLHIAHPNVLEDLSIYKCPEFRLIGLDWGSLLNLQQLTLDSLQALKQLPKCPIQYQALGNLQIDYY